MVLPFFAVGQEEDGPFIFRPLLEILTDFLVPVVRLRTVCVA